MRIIRSFACSAIVASFYLTGAASAQEFPQRPVTIVVGFSPGGSTDIIARMLAEGMSQRLRQQVVVENRAGADGNIAAAHVAQSAPDGYTLLLASASVAINYGIYKSIKFNPITDFQPIGLIGETQNMLLVSPDVPATNLQDLITLSKTRHLFYASTAANVWLGTEKLKQLSGLRVERIPFKGAGQAFPAVLSGQVQLLSAAVVTALPYVQSGKLRAIMVNGNTRSPLAPDIPSSKEQGVPDFSDGAWFGLVAPAKTPEATVNLLHKTMSELIQTPKYQEGATKLGLTLQPLGPNEFGEFIKRESNRWKAAADELDVKIE